MPRDLGIAADLFPAAGACVHFALRLQKRQRFMITGESELLGLV